MALHYFCDGCDGRIDGTVNFCTIRREVRVGTTDARTEPRMLDLPPISAHLCESCMRQLSGRVDPACWPRAGKVSANV